jgi:hypothetical protein
MKESSFRSLNLKRLTRKIIKLEETNHSWKWNISMIIRNDQHLFEPFRYRTEGTHHVCTVQDILDEKKYLKKLFLFVGYLTASIGPMWLAMAGLKWGPASW